MSKTLPWVPLRSSNFQMCKSYPIILHFIFSTDFHQEKQPAWGEETDFCPLDKMEKKNRKSRTANGLSGRGFGPEELMYWNTLQILFAFFFFLLSWHVEAFEVCFTKTLNFCLILYERNYNDLPIFLLCLQSVVAQVQNGCWFGTPA